MAALAPREVAIRTATAPQRTPEAFIPHPLRLRFIAAFLLLLVSVALLLRLGSLTAQLGDGYSVNNYEYAPERISQDLARANAAAAAEGKAPQHTQSEIKDRWSAQRLMPVVIQFLTEDYLLMFAYGFGYFLMCRALRDCLAGIWPTWIGSFAAVFALIAASSDALENALLLVAIHGHDQLRVAARVFTIAKWAFLLLPGIYVPVAGVYTAGRKAWGQWAQYLFFLRGPLLGAAVLIALPLADAFSPSFAAVSRGVLSVQGSWELLFVCWAAAQTSILLMVTSRVIAAYGCERFITTPPPFLKVRRDVSFLTLFGWLLVAVPLLARVVQISDWTVSLTTRVLIAIGGVLLSLLVLVIGDLIRVHEKDPSTPLDLGFGLPETALASEYLESLRRSKPWFEWITGPIARILGPGYLDPRAPKAALHSGHLLALGISFVLLVIYGVGQLWGHPGGPLDDRVAVCVYVLILLMFGVSFFSGLAFWADRFRIPSLFLIVVWMVTSTTALSDHRYQLSAASTQVPPGPADILQGWLAAHPNANQPLVIVTTSGGGIQATAWTVRVLTKLESEFSGQNGTYPFRNSVLLISGVSGGSIGAMLYGDSFLGRPKEAPDCTQRPNIDDQLNCNAKISSLRQVAWGLAYPDLQRAVAPLLTAQSPYRDRGWAIEEVLRTTMAQPDATLADWSAQTWGANGNMPAFIFNSTIADIGGRFVFTNFTTPGIDQAFPRRAPNFRDLYPGCDIKAVTAARLSAVFPYVSPMTRADLPCPSNSEKHPTFHLADGGYYDNDGIASALEWLNQAAGNLTNVAADAKKADTFAGHPVVWITIRSFPEFPDKTPIQIESDRAKGYWGSARQLVAPIATQVAVRTAAQRARNDYDIQRLLLAGVHYWPIAFSGKGADCTSPDSSTGQDLAEDPPLSWHLTRRQQRMIDCEHLSVPSDVSGLFQQAAN